MMAGEGEKARGRADVFVQRVTFFISGDDTLALHVREAGLKLCERGRDQFTEQFFGLAFGVHLDQRGQARFGLQVQVQHMAGRAHAPGGVLFPVLREFADFHVHLGQRL